MNAPPRSYREHLVRILDGVDFHPERSARRGDLIAVEPLTGAGKNGEPHWDLVSMVACANALAINEYRRGHYNYTAEDIFQDTIAKLLDTDPSPPFDASYRFLCYAKQTMRNCLHDAQRREARADGWTGWIRVKSIVFLSCDDQGYWYEITLPPRCVIPPDTVQHPLLIKANHSRYLLTVHEGSAATRCFLAVSKNLIPIDLQVDAMETYSCSWTRPRACGDPSDFANEPATDAAVGGGVDEADHYAVVIKLLNDDSNSLKLSKRERLVVLYVLEGLKPAEIAHAVGKSASNVTNAMNSAMQKIAAAINQMEAAYK